MNSTFDAIVVGSGITGGWAAKELTEKGLKVLMIERGRMIEHGSGYATETLAPWQLPFRGKGDAQLYERDYSVQRKARAFDEWTQAHFVNDRENPYQTTSDEPFQWRRGYQLGGRSLMWGRQCYRWSDLDFEANKKDGHGVDWPIRYADIAPWYDYVEGFIGVSGSKEGLAQLPDGQFQPPMALNAVEAALKAQIESHYDDRRLIVGRCANLTQAKPGRAPCQYRSICARGCSYGAYFSTQSSTLPAARATGNLTLLTDSLVERVIYDQRTRRATGVHVLDVKSGAYATYTARLVFLCASAFDSAAILLRSASEQFPTGLANSSGVLGKYIMDHANALSAMAMIPGFADRTYFGNRPTGIVIPRFRNVERRDGEYLRGYSYQGGAYRAGWPRGAKQAGIGADLKNALHEPGPWTFILTSYAESLPRAENRVTLDEKAKDPHGLPQTRIEFRHGENERKLLADSQAEATAMLSLLGAKIVASSATPGPGGTSIHEMGGARMGRDPNASVLNSHNQAHDVANLFVTDGACMASSACQNPSLTYMALTARAADFAVAELKAGRL